MEHQNAPITTNSYLISFNRSLSVKYYLLIFQIHYFVGSPDMCCRCGETQRKIWVFGVGTILIVLGGVTIALWPPFIESEIMKQLVIREGSPTFDKWAEIPIPIYLEVYLYNWTNPDKAKDPNMKPHFQEVGPFVWVEYRTKEDIVFHENGTVSFWIVRTWHFSEELTKADMDGEITGVNLIPLVSILLILNIVVRRFTKDC